MRGAAPLDSRIRGMFHVEHPDLAHNVPSSRMYHPRRALLPPPSLVVLARAGAGAAGRRRSDASRRTDAASRQGGWRGGRLPTSLLAMSKQRSVAAVAQGMLGDSIGRATRRRRRPRIGRRLPVITATSRNREIGVRLRTAPRRNADREGGGGLDWPVAQRRGGFACRPGCRQLVGVTATNGGLPSA
jgi:hypothetical protein